MANKENRFKTLYNKVQDFIEDYALQIMAVLFIIMTYLFLDKDNFWDEPNLFGFISSGFYAAISTLLIILAFQFMKLILFFIAIFLIYEHPIIIYLSLSSLIILAMISSDGLRATIKRPLSETLAKFGEVLSILLVPFVAIAVIGNVLAWLDRQPGPGAYDTNCIEGYNSSYNEYGC